MPETSAWGLGGHRVSQALLAPVYPGAQEDTSHSDLPCLCHLSAQTGCETTWAVTQPEDLLCWSVRAGWGCLVESWKDIMSNKHIACQIPDRGTKHKLWTLVPKASQMTELGCLSCLHLLVVILVEQLSRTVSGRGECVRGREAPISQEAAWYGDQGLDFWCPHYADLRSDPGSAACCICDLGQMAYPC